ncbi:MAG: hypothetical protein LBU89_00460 [Fibromonadaceae bacterium]|jgi:antitoxin (DNA-binding transcriptional repressor) of toxin-antitoxin stability system|nr:hypothetical protein [Fibromonadaceae bacterium]
MEAMSVGKLKAQLPAVLATVRNGGRVGILHGRNKRTIAMIIPFTEIEEVSSYEIGKKYFGKYGSGNGTFTQNHKKILKRKLYGKLRSR